MHYIDRPGRYGPGRGPFMDVATNASEDFPHIRGAVLVVEDQAELRQAIGELLHEEGFQVEFAGDGSQAVAAASREEPDVVLMDLRLPGADGLEAVQQIKSLVPQAQFIVHSWYLDPATRKLMENEGIYRFLAKGTASRSIVEAVEQALAHKRWLEAGSP